MHRGRDIVRGFHSRFITYPSTGDARTRLDMINTNASAIVQVKPDSDLNEMTTENVWLRKDQSLQISIPKTLCGVGGACRKYPSSCELAQGPSGRSHRNSKQSAGRGTLNNYEHRGTTFITGGNLPSEYNIYPFNIQTHWSAITLRIKSSLLWFKYKNTVAFRTLISVTFLAISVCTIN